MLARSCWSKARALKTNAVPAHICGYRHDPGRITIRLRRIVDSVDGQDSGGCQSSRRHTQLIIDVGPGRSEMFSLENGSELRFLTRSRLFEDSELPSLAPVAVGEAA